MQTIITNAIARYPRLNATYKFDSSEGKSVKCDPMDDGAAYETQFVISEDEARKLQALCMDAWNNARTTDKKKKWPETPNLLPFKKDDDTGEIIGKAKLKGSYKAEKTLPPKQVDAKRNPMPTDFMLTTGSRINIAVTVVPYNTGSVNGVSLRLRSVQVIELAQNEVTDPFSEVDGYVIGNGADDFTSIPNTSASEAVGDDEIPW